MKVNIYIYFLNLANELSSRLNFGMDNFNFSMDLAISICLIFGRLIYVYYLKINSASNASSNMTLSLEFHLIIDLRIIWICVNHIIHCVNILVIYMMLDWFIVRSNWICSECQSCVLGFLCAMVYRLDELRKLEILMEAKFFESI